MWQPSDSIALGALIVAAISAIVAAISVATAWWDRRDARPESYRSALYGRQLSVVDDFAAMVRKAHLELGNYQGEDSAPLQRAQEQLTEFAVSSAFMPPEVVSAASEWAKDCAEAIESRPGEPSRQERLDQAWRLFVRRVRAETGATGLHRQVRERTGAAAAERRRRDDFTRLRRLDIELEVLSRGRYRAPSSEEVWRGVREDESRDT